MLNRRGFLLSGAAGLAPLPVWANTRDDTVAALLQKLIGAGDSAGIVAGILDRDGSRVVPVGRSTAVHGDPLDGDTVFEIASITKIFTALLLADMALRGEVALDDPAAKYLPAHVHVPEYEGRAITLRHLVTYTSGLPGFPDNFPPLDRTRPFPDYSIDQMYAALGDTRLAFAPGEHYRYTNFGFGLLGHVLSRCAGMRYEDLVVSRICRPLGMDSTRITLTPGMRGRRAAAHSVKDAVESWRQPPALEAASAFCSTVNDLLRFLGAAMGRVPSSLAPAFAALLQPRRSMKSARYPGMNIAAGWFVYADHGDELIWKNGDTLGYTSFIGYSAKNRQGLVLLANGEFPGTLTDLAWHLLNAEFPAKSGG